VDTPSPHHDANSPPGRLVVLGSGPQAQWEHAMRGLAAGGPLLLVDRQPATWQRPHLVGARVANLLNPAQVIDAVRKFAIAHPIAGVVNFHPAYTPAALLIRRELGLPGADHDASEICTLRHRTAELLALAGVDHSAARHAATYGQALEAAHHAGFPLVCKPASPRKRHAARVVSALPELAEAFATATAATWPGTGTLIEPFLHGIEASAYTYSTSAGTRLIAVSHATFDPQAEPSLVPIEVVVDADDVCSAAIEDIACRALVAIGHRHGPAQLRLRITATGPQIISISTHLTDPLLGLLIEQTTGVDLIAASGAYARGHMPHLQHAPLGASAVRYLQAPGPVTHAAPPGAHANITPFTHLDQYDTAQQVGPVRRTGHLLVTGADFPQCVTRLASAVAQLRGTRLSA